MAGKRTYVTYKDIEEIRKQYNPNYTIIYGGRNDGKSYAAKEKVIRDFLKNGSMFTYLRRYDADIKGVDNVDYWGDFIAGSKNKLSALSKGQYNNIEYEKGKLFLSSIDAEGKITRGPQCGYVHALSLEQRYKSMQFPKVETIIYEEFCTSGMYLYNETVRFMSYVSTVARDRMINVLLIGNTISRQNVFFREWELLNIAKQKPGTVDIYKFDHENQQITIAAYYTTTIKDNTMFFGQAAKMITGGEWESHEQPHLIRPEKDYQEIYRMSFETDSMNRFLMRFLVLGDNGIWYVTKRTSDFKENERVISPRLMQTPLYTANFTAINDAEKLLFKYLTMGRIAYGDNLTGTEFKRALKQLTIINHGE